MLNLYNKLPIIYNLSFDFKEKYYIIKAMRRSIINKEMIMEATIKYVGEYSLENVTTKKIASSLGISEGSVFNYFPNKKALLCECLSYIDSHIDSVLKGNKLHSLSISKNIKELWYTYFNYLVDKSDYAKFYRQFRHSSYYTTEVIANQDNSYNFFTKFINKNMDRFLINPDIFWVFIIETTLNFAIRVADNELPSDEKSIDNIYNLISHGFVGIIKKSDD